MWLVIIAVSILFIVYMVNIYNKLNHLKVEIEESSSNIGNAIELRAAVLDDALNIATVGYNREVEGYQKLSASEKYQNLFALGQTYPDLKATEGYTEALKFAKDYSMAIKAEKHNLNEVVGEYNKILVTFPASLVASYLGFKKEEFTDEKHSKKNRKVIKRKVDIDRYNMSNQS